MRKLIRYLLIIVILFIVFSKTIVYSDIVTPDLIKIGLNHGNQTFHNINIRSINSIEFILNKDEKENTIIFKKPINFSFRKDTYYNILNGETKKIQFVKAVKYSGELIGPYHIQIGNAYNNYNSAKEALNLIEKSIKDACIAYDKGWKIWYGTLLDEKECKEEINILQKKLSGAKCTIIEPDENRVQVIDGLTGNVVLIYNSDEILLKTYEPVVSLPLIEYNGSNYRGDIMLKILDDSSIGVINALPFECYLYGVVPCEIYPSWDKEALKAQAVAARNYAMLNINRHKNDGFDLCNTQHCQVYKGYDVEETSTNKAVDETKGRLLFYKDELVQTYYHSSSGGHTENSENVWNEALPYIKGVDDRYGLGSPNDEWIAELEKPVIEEKLKQNAIDIGKVIDINVSDVSEFGRVKELKISGTKNTETLNKEKARLVLGTSILKSTWYEVSTESDLNIFEMNKKDTAVKRPAELNIISANGKSMPIPKGNNIYIKGLFEDRKVATIPNIYIFKGKGWGHGLGMSQYGAKGMAEEGYDYKEILEYYYKDSILK
ncbi:MAG: SpoIID/LytB domain-containing protein [Firmicutes bacterium]|nr:SpoIID/LytB domain-containing protein [Bacillota bacterium]